MLSNLLTNVPRQHLITSTIDLEWWAVRYPVDTNNKKALSLATSVPFTNEKSNYFLGNYSRRDFHLHVQLLMFSFASDCPPLIHRKRRQTGHRTGVRLLTRPSASVIRTIWISIRPDVGEAGVSRLGLVVMRSAGKAEGRRFDSPIRLTFVFQNCDWWTLARDFALYNQWNIIHGSHSCPS